MKILVVALDNLGDAVMASAVLEPLKRLYPHAKLGLWVKAYAADLFEGHPLLDTVHAADPFWDRSPGKAKGAVAPFLRAWNEVRAARYDAALILNAEWRRVLSCRLAGIPEVVGYRGKKAGFFLTHAFSRPAGIAHFSDEHLGLLTRWSGKPSSGEALPRLEASPADEAGLSDRGYTVVHPFSGDEEKNWPLASWAELLRRSPGERFVILCGPGEEARLKPHLKEFPAADVLAAPSLGRLKAALSRARLVIGGDSGPEHAAAALGTPVLSLFGPTDPARCRPRGRGTLKVLRANPLKTLPVDDVLAAMAAFPPA